MRGFVALFLAVFSAHQVVQARTVELRVNTENLDRKTRSVIHTVLAEIKTVLPKKLSNALSDKPIFIEFKVLDDSEKIRYACEDVSDEIAGRNIHARLLKGKSRRIQVHSRFLSELHKPESAESCGRAPREHFKAAIVHEIAHLYDFYPHWTEAEISKRTKACAKSGSPHSGVVRDKAKCRYLRRRGYFSESGQFLALNNFSKPKKSQNEKVGGEELYATESAREAYAVNFERFLLDPHFACRRPALHRYYADIFRHKPFGIERCPNLNTKVFTRNDPTDLDPERVTEIHYFFAGRGEKMMSHWGHAMFRLVVCSTSRQEPVPECLSDIRGTDTVIESTAVDPRAVKIVDPQSGETRYVRVTNRGGHKIISFRANIDDIAPGVLKGLRGVYPSQLFVLNQYEVVSEYTKGELREVMSLPLKLTPAQKEMFIYKVLEDYYLYRGRYYFLGNNCATESLRLLRAVLADDQFAGLEHLNDPVSPIAVKKALIESGLADDSLLKDTKAAVESGHYYRSFAVDLENAHKFISSKYPAFKEQFADFRSWAEYGSADSRRHVIEQALDIIKGGRAVDEIAARAAFKNLEEHRLLVLGERIKAEVVKGDQEFKKKVAEILGRNAKAFRLNYENLVAAASSKHYGIPESLEEYVGSIDTGDIVSQAELEAVRENAINELRQYLGPAIAEYEKTRDLIAELL